MAAPERERRPWLLTVLALSTAACSAVDRLARIESVAGSSTSSSDATGSGSGLSSDLSSDPGSGPSSSTDEASSAQEGSSADSGVPVHGQVSARYRFRTVGGEDDHDLYGTLLLDIGDPDRNAYSGHIMAWGSADLDEKADGSSSAFFGITDTYDSAVVGRLYYAYVDKHDVDALETLRLGRQQVFETPEVVSFDGLLAATQPTDDRGLQIGAYGGIPVHQFESSASGDAVVGAWAGARPWSGGRVRLDYMHLEDDYLQFENQNDLAAVSVTQRVGEKTQLRGETSWLDGHERDLEVRASYLDAESSLRVEGIYYRLFETQRNLAQELDPFFTALLDYYPFHRGSLVAAVNSEHVLLEGGFDIRRVADDDDVGDFNRDYERYYARTGLIDVLDEGLSANVTGEVWNGAGNDVQTWGLDLTKEWSEALQSSLGTYYSLYKTDFIAVEEKENVRTYYLDLRRKQNDRLTLDLRYEFEQDDFDDYHIVKLGTRWSF